MSKRGIIGTAALVAEAHAGQTDRQGEPYIEHLLRVAAAVPAHAQRVALLHDAIEDGKLTRAQVAGHLLLAGGDDTELTAIDLLTRGAGSYSDYIETIATAPGPAGDLARIVKRADLADNLGRLPPELEHLRPQYESAAARLDSVT